MTTVATTCDNPRCTCSPCTCGEGCRCGTARLGDLEQRVMEVLWDASGRELSARDVTDRLPGYALTTIATILDRLSKKGIVRRRAERRFVRFTPIDSRADHTAALMREALGTTDEPEEAIVQFVKKASPAEARALRRALGDDDARRPGTARPGS